MKGTFQLGEVQVSSGAQHALIRDRRDLCEFLTRHMHCDWGEELNQDDHRVNELALEHGCGLSSAYRLRDGQTLLIRTHGSRLMTFVWLASEDDE